jgi:hypothetical protein
MSHVLCDSNGACREMRLPNGHRDVTQWRRTRAKCQILQWDPCRNQYRRFLSASIRSFSLSLHWNSRWKCLVYLKLLCTLPAMRCIGFEALRAVAMKISVFWDITPLVSRNLTDVSEKNIISIVKQAPASLWFLACFILLPWRWRRYVSPKLQLTSDYTALYPRKWNS